MVHKLLFVLCVVSVTGVVGLAQERRTVTNSDLERYRQARVNAERELNEDYSRLGFASPEERANQNAASEQKLMELSQQLKEQRLANERMELEREQMILMSTPPVGAGYDNSAQSGDEFYPTYWGSGRGGSGRGRGRQQNGYFAGGQFWPQGTRTPARPLIAPAHPAPHH